jgi:cytochrome b
MIASLLKQNPADKAAIVLELVWGILASSEFRFSP